MVGGLSVGRGKEVVSGLENLSRDCDVDRGVGAEIIFILPSFPSEQYEWIVETTHVT